MFDTIYPKELLQLNKSEAPFLDSNLSITNYIISTKIYDKRGDFDIVMVPVLDDYVSHLVMLDFNDQNKMLISKLLKQRYCYHKLCKTVYRCQNTFVLNTSARRSIRFRNLWRLSLLNQ